ncbi:hypothetical protein ACCD10_08830 [Pseudomonas sp. Pseusp122]|uniref:hypothetical protein n=1 Tax=unclassified Pseudomonas TaxID=196821 RepID=UPI0039A55ED9
MEFSLALSNNPSPQSLIVDALSAAISAKTAPAQAETPAKPGVEVLLSDKGLSKARYDRQFADIDASKLPTTVKEQLKTIRRIQLQIAEKKAELKAVMKNHLLTPKEREVKARLLQLEMTNLSNTMTVATNSIGKTMGEMTLPLDQIGDANKLMNKEPS